MAKMSSKLSIWSFNFIMKQRLKTHDLQTKMRRYNLTLQSIFLVFFASPFCFSIPCIKVFDTKRGSITEVHAYITQRALLAIEWRHELIANDWRSMFRNLAVVCFSVMFTTKWLMLQPWRASLPSGRQKQAVEIHLLIVVLVV